MLCGDLILTQCDCGLHGPWHRCCVAMNSWLLSLQRIHFMRSSVQMFVLWVSALSLLHVISCTKLSGSRRIQGDTKCWILRAPLALKIQCFGNSIFLHWPGHYCIIPWTIFSHQELLGAPPLLTTEHPCSCCEPQWLRRDYEAPFGSTRGLSISKVRQSE